MGDSAPHDTPPQPPLPPFRKLCLSVPASASHSPPLASERPSKRLPFPLPRRKGPIPSNTAHLSPSSSHPLPTPDAALAPASSCLVSKLAVPHTPSIHPSPPSGHVSPPAGHTSVEPPISSEPSGDERCAQLIGQLAVQLQSLERRAQPESHSPTDQLPPLPQPPPSAPDEMESARTSGGGGDGEWWGLRALSSAELEAHKDRAVAEWLARTSAARRLQREQRRRGLVRKSALTSNPPAPTYSASLSSHPAPSSPRPCNSASSNLFHSAPTPTRGPSDPTSTLATPTFSPSTPTPTPTPSIPAPSTPHPPSLPPSSSNPLSHPPPTQPPFNPPPSAPSAKQSPSLPTTSELPSQQPVLGRDRSPPAHLHLLVRRTHHATPPLHQKASAPNPHPPKPPPSLPHESLPFHTCSPSPSSPPSAPPLLDSPHVPEPGEPGHFAPPPACQPPPTAPIPHSSLDPTPSCSPPPSQAHPCDAADVRMGERLIRASAARRLQRASRALRASYAKAMCAGDVVGTKEEGGTGRVEGGTEEKGQGRGGWREGGPDVLGEEGDEGAIPPIPPLIPPPLGKKAGGQSSNSLIEGRAGGVKGGGLGKNEDGLLAALASLNAPPAPSLAPSLHLYLPPSLAPSTPPPRPDGESSGQGGREVAREPTPSTGHSACSDLSHPPPGRLSCFSSPDRYPSDRYTSGSLPSDDSSPQSNPSNRWGSPLRSGRLGRPSLSACELLIFVCSPSKYPLPHLQDEALQVSRSIQASIFVGGTAKDLRRRLLSKPTRRFLFSGHANTALRGAKTLGFTGEEGELAAVHPPDLVQMLGAHSPRNGGGLELVFLNGCHSEALGAAVHAAGVPYVVCWRTLAENSAARLFASTFFETLSQGHDYIRCFREARSELALQVRPGRLADGTHCSVPKFTLTDPELPSEANDFKPRPFAAGIPIILHTPHQTSLTRSEGSLSHGSTVGDSRVQAIEMNEGFSAELCPPAGHERIPAHLMATSSTPLPLGEEEETPETQEFGGRHEGNCLTDESGAIAAVLPGIDGVDILALGNQIQPRYRPHTEGGEGGERGQSLVVATLQLIDHERRSTPWVSRLHAEVFFKGESLFLVSVGKSFSFVNEVPIHADDPRFDKQMRLYDQDELRFGGNLTGKTGGCYSKFVFHVNCPSLGKRPPPDC